MREYELIINESIKNGLSPEKITPINTPVLYECLGFRCGRLGLQKYIEGSNPLPALFDIVYNWPYPQYIKSDAHNFLIIEDVGTTFIYLVSDDMETISLAISIPTGNLVSIADFGEYVFMTNGLRLVYWNVATASWTSAESTANIPRMKVICNLNGQAIGGNVDTAWYDCDETFYVWSSIGYLNFLPEIDNEAGYRRCPYGGEVLGVKKIGQNEVIGYSSKGIVRMSLANEPVQTIAFTELDDVGLINMGAVGGSTMRHVYVGTDYKLREVNLTGDLSKYYAVGEIGYVKQMESLAGEDIIVTYDPRSKSYFIGNSQKTFLLSPYGLTEIPQHPSAVWDKDTDDVYMLPDAVDDFEPLITTEAFDFAYRGGKSIAGIETDAEQGNGAECKVDYAYGNSWNSSTYKPINKEGVAAVSAYADKFRTSLKFTDVNNDFRISYIKVRFKMADLRSIRGVYAPPTSFRGQNDN
jgi:hypothetical protein